MHTCVLKLWQDKEVLQNKEVLILNNVGINVNCQAKGDWQDL